MNGDLWRIIPREGFVLEPGSAVEVYYVKPGSVIKEAEAPSAPYLVFGRGDIGEVRAINTYTVRPFPGLEKVFPPETGIVLPDAGWVYQQNGHLKKISPEDGVVLPTPMKSHRAGGREILEGKIRIGYSRGLKQEAGYLSAMLEVVTGTAPRATEGKVAGSNTIQLEWAGGSTAGKEGDEAYSLKVLKDQGIHITGSGKAGIFYGIQSLLAMLPVESWSNKGGKLEIPCVTISDAPAFGYRGIMLDVARNFHPPEAIRKLVDVMAFYKLNRLHLSLTNDEAWRLEIPALPELTSTGGYRGHTTDSKNHLIPAYGSGPFPDPATGTGSGYLTRDDFVELLEYAAARHVEVIPEINFPGHARAAIYAMEARYDKFMARGELEEAERFRLIDPGDRSVYNSAQNFHDNVVCVCGEAPFLFYETVVDEIASMYRDAGLRLTVIHTGGDEVPRGAWTGSPVCDDFLAAKPGPGTPADLQVYFERRILEILTGKGLVMAGWEEIALKRESNGRWSPNPEFNRSTMLPYVWNSLGDYLDLGNRMANAGYHVVLCNVQNLYFDLAYNHHPAEPGLYWGGFVNTRDAFAFDPFNPEFGKEGMESLERDSRENIAGLQGQLWSETLNRPDLVEYYYLPKMIGLAERAWSGQAEWGKETDPSLRASALDSAWNLFANVIGHRELPRLDHLFGGYLYRLPPPGALIQQGMLHANTGFPGLTIRYTTDGTDPDRESAVYTGPVKVTGQVKFATFDTRGRGSRVSMVE